MLIRLLLILTLLMQPAALAAVATGSAPVNGCPETCCCQIVEAMTCCGQPVREMQCSSTGGQCPCGLQPGDSDPVREAPRHAPRTDMGPILIGLGGLAVDLPTPIRSHVVPASPTVVRTHNETRALLCLWRT